MKTFNRAIFFVFFILAAIGASSQASKTATVESKLAKLGFHVFPSPQQLPAGKVTPLNAAEGQSLAIDKLGGPVTLLNFWATWCPPCKGEMPSIQKLNDAMKGTNFRIVAVSVGEDRKTVASFIKEKGYSFPVYLDSDGSVGQQLASQGIPTTYILDKTGKVIAGAVGAREYDDPAIISILKELAAR